MKITIKVDGLKAIERAFDTIAKSVADFRPYWKDVQKEFFEIETRLFASEGQSGRSGRKWAALKPDYAKAKLKKYGQLPIMQRTGALYSSLTSNTGDTVFETSKNEAIMGTSLAYGVYHQHGSRKVPLPVRKTISFRIKDAEQLVKPIKEGLEKVAKKVKLKG